MPIVEGEEVIVVDVRFRVFAVKFIRVGAQVLFQMIGRSELYNHFLARQSFERIQRSIHVSG